MTDGLIEFLKDMISGMSMTDELSGMADRLTDGFGVTNSFIETAVSALQGVGICLVLIYFCLGLMDEISRSGDATLNMIMKMIIKLTATLLIIVYLPSLITDLRKVGKSMVYLFEAIGVSKSDPTKLADVGDDLGFGEALKMVLEMFFPWILSKISFLAVDVAVYSRAIEIIIRGAFAPIAVADMFQDGTRSPGFRYLKKLAAVILQGAIIIAIMSILGAMEAKMVTTSGGQSDVDFWALLVVNFTAVAMVWKSIGFANDVCGV